MLLAALLACVGTAWAQTRITSLADVQENTSYVLYGKRAGVVTKQDGTGITAVKPDAGYDKSADVSQFAFIKHSDKYFLWSVSASKFLAMDGSLQATSQPDAIEFVAASGDYKGYVRMRFADNTGKNININNAGNSVVIDGWNFEDDGSTYYVEVSKEGVDLSAAIALLNSSVEVTYVYKYNGAEVARKTKMQDNNSAYSAPDLGYYFTFTYPDNNTVSATNKEIEVVCTDNLPFTVSTDYANATWYVLQIRSNQKKYVVRGESAPYANTTTTPTTEDALWAFVGNPIDGIQVLNKAAGEGYTLGLDGNNGVMTEGTTTWNITKGVNGFLLRNGNEGNNYFHDFSSELKIWANDAAAGDPGSAFVVTSEADMKTLATTALNNAKAQVAVYDEADYYTYSQEAVTAAKTALDAIATPADMLTALTAKNGVESAMATLTATTKGAAAPAVGDYIRLKNKQHGGFLKANDANLTNSTDTDLSTLWLVEEGSEGTVKLKSVGNNKYIGEIRQSTEVAMVESTDAKEFAWTNQTEAYAVFKETTGGGYAYGHISGGKLVGWEASADATQWIVSKVEYSASYKVVYEYQYEEETVATQETYILAGDEYPDFTYAGPYGVVVADAKPEGQVTKDETLQIALEIEKELPFDAVAEGTPTTWYYAQMHAFPGYGFYISANEGNLVWHGANDENAHKIADNANVDNYLWGFVGNLWEGYKMVNKAGKAVCSTGSGEVSVGELAEATTLIAWNSQANGEWFCLKSSNNYLNLNTANTVINHWSANDNGSSIFLTEFNKTYSLEVTAAGYATYYSQYRLAIPETVKAYVVSEVEGAYAVLEQVTGVLPAYTGVIIEGEEGTYEFVTSAAAPATIASNKLQGTIVNTEVSDNAYILADGVDGVGLYKVELTDGKFTNNANKAYLPASAIASANAPMLSFNRGEGTTSIDELSTVNGQQTTVIYDLTGRRVEKMEKGIYIVNGRKVVIK